MEKMGLSFGTKQPMNNENETDIKNLQIWKEPAGIIKMHTLEYIDTDGKEYIGTLKIVETPGFEPTKYFEFAGYIVVIHTTSNISKKEAEMIESKITSQLLHKKIEDCFTMPGNGIF